MNQPDHLGNLEQVFYQFQEPDSNMEKLGTFKSRLKTHLVSFPFDWISETIPFF